jgi:hypothetical protein
VRKGSTQAAVASKEKIKVSKRARANIFIALNISTSFNISQSASFTDNGKRQSVSLLFSRDFSLS